MYRSTKTYDHNLGFSCCYRQHRATSHCHFLHGYALAFKFSFEAPYLDDKNWVVDFGGLNLLKNKLKFWFDHTTLIAKDDPHIHFFNNMTGMGLIQLRAMDAVGCEAFAHHAWLLANEIIPLHYKYARVVSCEVSEHGANSAIYTSEERTQKVDQR